MITDYVQALFNRINAVWYWQISSNRYRYPNFPFPELI